MLSLMQSCYLLPAYRPARREIVAPGPFREIEERTGVKSVKRAQTGAGANSLCEKLLKVAESCQRLLQKTGYLRLEQALLTMRATNTIIAHPGFGYDE